MKTLLHINEMEKWETVLGNAARLAEFDRGQTGGWAVEVVANGPAVGGLTRETAALLGISSEMEKLSAEGVTLVACRNALKENGISEERLCPWVGVVASGVVELSLRQTKGFAYIKP